MFRRGSNFGHYPYSYAKNVLTFRRLDVPTSSGGMQKGENQNFSNDFEHVRPSEYFKLHVFCVVCFAFVKWKRYSVHNWHGNVSA